MHPFVLHPDGDLHEQAAPGRRGQQPDQLGVVQRVPVVCRIEPDAAHLVLLVAAPQVLFPIWPDRINAADWDQESTAVLSAFVGQPPVSHVQLLVNHRFEAARPRLHNPVPAQLAHECLGAVVLQPAEGPPENVHVSVDDFRSGGGLFGRRDGSPVPDA